MGPLIVAVLAASLMGSAHCAGMCGGFVLFALGGAPCGTRIPAWRLHAAYHGGRLITYAVLGATAGALGAALDLGGGLLGWQRAATVIAGAMMMAFGGLALASALGVRTPPAPLPETLRHWVVRGHARALQLAPLARAFIVGLLTTFLPCGWLYAFVITAAGTASPAWGGLTMAVFWLGTLPVLVTLGAGVRSLGGWLGPRLPVLTALLIVAVGFYTLTGRARIDGAALAAAVESRHGAPLTKPDWSAATVRVESLMKSPPACCTGEAPHGE